jgi:hypothetical protein
MWLMGLVLMSVHAGCNHGPAMGTVKGEVTLDGQPLREGRILFVPEDGQGQTGGSTITDGKFTAEVPVAKMKVQINANEVVGRQPAYEGVPNSPMIDVVKEKIPVRYNDKSELSLEVKRGSQSVKYELKKK